MLTFHLRVHTLTRRISALLEQTVFYFLVPCGSGFQHSNKGSHFQGWKAVFPMHQSGWGVRGFILAMGFNGSGSISTDIFSVLSLTPWAHTSTAIVFPFTFCQVHDNWCVLSQVREDSNCLLFSLLGNFRSGVTLGIYLYSAVTSWKGTSLTPMADYMILMYA